MSVPGSTIAGELAWLLPGLQATVTCPEGCTYITRIPDCSCSTCTSPPTDGETLRKYTVNKAIQHLNDVHRWTREQIADWLESLDVDLTFPTEPPPNRPTHVATTNEGFPINAVVYGGTGSGKTLLGAASVHSWGPSAHSVFNFFTAYSVSGTLKTSTHITDEQIKLILGLPVNPPPVVSVKKWADVSTQATSSTQELAAAFLSKPKQPAWAKFNPPVNPLKDNRKKGRKK